MAALTASRNTPRYGEDAVGGVLSFPVKAATKIFAGSIVVLNAGFAAPCTGVTGLIAVGVALRDVDNSAGANGALNVDVRGGVFAFNVLGADPVAQADCGITVFGEDDNTIRKTSNTSTRSSVGKFAGFDPVTGQALVLIALY